MAPRAQPGPSAHVRVSRIAQGRAHGPDGRAHPLGTDPQRTVRGTAADPREQPSDQGHGALFADLAAQPPARFDHHGQRHPPDAALLLDAERIGLPLSQVPGLFDEVCLHSLPLSPGACPGHPWASKVTTRTTVCAEVRSREQTVP